MCTSSPFRLKFINNSIYATWCLQDSHQLKLRSLATRQPSMMQVHVFDLSTNIIICPLACIFFTCTPFFNASGYRPEQTNKISSHFKIFVRLNHLTVQGDSTGHLHGLYLHQIWNLGHIWKT